MELPEVNAQEDPAYEAGLTPGSVLPALTQCSLDDSEIPVLREVIEVFTDALVDGGGAAYVNEHLAGIPQVSADDRSKLVDGARQSSRFHTSPSDRPQLPAVVAVAFRRGRQPGMDSSDDPARRELEDQ